MNGQAENQNESKSVQSAKVLIGILKKCYKCGEIKLVGQFNRNRTKKDGLADECKPCNKAHRQLWREKNPLRARESNNKWLEKNKGRVAKAKKMWNEKNKEKIKTLNHEWYIENKEKHYEYNKRWAQKNPDKTRLYGKRMREKYPEKTKEKRRICNAKRRMTLRWKLNHCIANSIYANLKKNKGGRKWQEIVGYNLDQLKAHLEKQFKDGMSWENHGEWHIDHIIPISVFNFKKPEDEDFKRCWALKNLQPLWAIENIRKNNKLDKHFQPKLIF